MHFLQQDLTNNPDKYLTLAKYKDVDSGKAVNDMIEEERRSKAYNKIINQSTSVQQVL